MLSSCHPAIRRSSTGNMVNVRASSIARIALILAQAFTGLAFVLGLAAVCETILFGPRSQKHHAFCSAAVF